MRGGTYEVMMRLAADRAVRSGAITCDVRSRVKPAELQNALNETLLTVMLVHVCVYACVQFLNDYDIHYCPEHVFYDVRVSNTPTEFLCVTMACTSHEARVDCHGSCVVFPQEICLIVGSVQRTLLWF